MIGLTSHHRYYMYNDVCDMRKGFDGLSGLIKPRSDEDASMGKWRIYALL